MKINFFKKSVLFMALGAVSVYTVFGQINSQKNQPETVPGRYIVILRDSVSDSSTVSKELGRAHGLDLDFSYNNVVKGFAAAIPEAKLKTLRQDPRVAFISEDRAVSAYGLSLGQGNSSAIRDSATNMPQTVPAGINRIKGRQAVATGAGIGVAVIDTGIDFTHPDLTANIASVNKTCVRGTQSAKDDNGHGTHVAGTIAAANNATGVVGVAPNAKLYAVKVLDKNGSGSWSSVICGIDWVTANATTYGIKVANMSLGGGGASDNNCGKTNNDALHKAICNSVAKGVTYVVAAGNDGVNSTNSVPASYDDAVITVSALADSDGASGGFGSTTAYGKDDIFATFSNYGSSVDIAAPGVSILSTWKGGTYNTISGTSMATPHVAGAAALYISTHPGVLWTQVKDALRSLGESLGSGHTDPSLLHPEPVLQVDSL